MERVIVTAEDLPDEAMMDLVRNCGAVSVKVSLVPDHINALGPSVAIDDIEGLTILGLNPLRALELLAVSQAAARRRRRDGWAAAGRAAGGGARDRDQARLAGTGAVPPARIGRDGQRVQMLKFRSMFVGAERGREELRDLNEQRPDWLFKLDRRPADHAGRPAPAQTRLDELPQLWNVLVGEMSLVGPRPLVAGRARADRRLVARRRLDVSPA